MYDIAPWLGEAKIFLVLAILFVGYVAVSWLWSWLWPSRVHLQGRDRGAVPTNKLNAGNFSSELKTVTDWHQLGIKLGLEMHELEKIERDYRGIHRQMLQTLKLWLQNTPDASWLNVVSALEEMGENRVAANIRRKYIRGGIQSKL